MDKKVNDFIIFCIEMYKLQHSLTGKQAFNLFKEYKVIDYLESGYEVLHTQGDRWLMNDIEEFLKIREVETKDGEKVQTSM